MTHQLEHIVLILLFRFQQTIFILIMVTVNLTYNKTVEIKNY
jgi:hypothetical protein